MSADIDKVSAPDVTPESAHAAAKVLAGRAIEICTCMPEMRHHSPKCPALCGLSNVIDALSIREMTVESKTSQKKVL